MFDLSHDTYSFRAERNRGAELPITKLANVLRGHGTLRGNGEEVGHVAVRNEAATERRRNEGEKNLPSRIQR